jgi:hypothetical protein
MDDVQEMRKGGVATCLGTLSPDLIWLSGVLVGWFSNSDVSCPYRVTRTGWWTAPRVLVGKAKQEAGLTCDRRECHEYHLQRDDIHGLGDRGNMKLLVPLCLCTLMYFALP